MNSTPPLAGNIAGRIVPAHQRAVLLDVDLARMHGLPLRRLRRLVQEHYQEFPGELCFQPDSAQLPARYAHEHVHAFTEPGVWMVAAVLGTPTARAATIEISRAFEQRRREWARGPMSGVGA